MALRYFCDNCGTETRPDELRVLLVAVGPKSEWFDICPACSSNLTIELELCRKTKRKLELIGTHATEGGALTGLDDYLAAVVKRLHVRRLARGLSYLLVVTASFVAVTLLTSLR